MILYVDVYVLSVCIVRHGHGYTTPEDLYVFNAYLLHFSMNPLILPAMG